MIEIMRQIGADHEKRAIIQQRVDDCGNLLRSGVAHEQRNEAEASEHRLQERQLDLKGMFGRMGPIVDADKACFHERGDGVSIDLDLAERRGESSGGGCGNAAHRDVMGRADHERPLKVNAA